MIHFGRHLLTIALLAGVSLTSTAVSFSTMTVEEVSALLAQTESTHADMTASAKDGVGSGDMMLLPVVLTA